MTSGNPEPARGEAAEPPVFAAVIRPHRSLGAAGFRTLMALCGLVTMAASAVFVAFGLWPVAGFFGLDLLALYVAFRVSFRQGRSFEEIVLTRLELLCRKVTPGGRGLEWRFNPLWTRLHREGLDAEFGLARLALASRGERVVIARDLSPPEREDLADALGRALADVKRGY